MTVLASLATGVSWNAAALTQIISVTGPDTAVTLQPSTHMGTTGMKETVVPTVVNLGTVTVEKFYDGDDTVDIAMITDCEAKTTRALVITETDGTPKTKTASTTYIQSISFGRTFDGLATMTVVFKISGAVTHA